MFVVPGWSFWHHMTASSASCAYFLQFIPHWYNFMLFSVPYNVFACTGLTFIKKMFILCIRALMMNRIFTSCQKVLHRLLHLCSTLQSLHVSGECKLVCLPSTRPSFEHSLWRGRRAVRKEMCIKWGRQCLQNKQPQTTSGREERLIVSG